MNIHDNRLSATTTTLRRLKHDISANTQAALDAGHITSFDIAINESSDTAILFSDKYYGWRYDGQEFDEDNDNFPDPRGEHYMEELLHAADDQGGEYSENYVSIGHCPHAMVGDALLLNGTLVEVLAIDVTEDPRQPLSVWLWNIQVQRITQ